MNQTETEKKPRGRRPAAHITMTIADIVALNKASSVSPLNTLAHVELLDNTKKVPRSRDEMLAFIQAQKEDYVMTPDDRYTVQGTVVNFADVLTPAGKLNPALDKTQTVEFDLHQLVKESVAQYEHNFRTLLEQFLPKTAQAETTAPTE
jgi:hypothetical protein